MANTSVVLATSWYIWRATYLARNVTYTCETVLMDQTNIPRLQLVIYKDDETRMMDGAKVAMIRYIWMWYNKKTINVTLKWSGTRWILIIDGIWPKHQLLMVYYHLHPEMFSVVLGQINAPKMLLVGCVYRLATCVKWPMHLT